MKIYRSLRPFFTDERGKMTYVLPDETDIQSVLLITSKKSSVRANHYHKSDRHYVYLLKGSMEYSYKENGKGNTKKITVKAGDTVFTPAGEHHKMTFLEDSEFLAMTTEKRDAKLYEKDTVRVLL